MKNEKTNSVLIIANGEPPGDEILDHLVARVRYIIAADGGSNTCHEKNIYPHFIIGDLDSIEEHVLEHFNDSEVIHLADQETNDLFKALLFVRSLQPEKVFIISAFGRRLDHSLANLILIHQEFHDLSLEFYDTFGRLSLISGESEIYDPVGQTVSLFSFLPVYGLSLEGFEYPIHNKDFPQGFNGLSNVIVHSPAKISVQKGFLLCYIVNH